MAELGHETLLYPRRRHNVDVDGGGVHCFIADLEVLLQAEAVAEGCGWCVGSQARSAATA
jgi:hypothetical protein